MPLGPRAGQQRRTPTPKSISIRRRRAKKRLPLWPGDARYQLTHLGRSTAAAVVAFRQRNSSRRAAAAASANPMRFRLSPQRRQKTAKIVRDGGG